MARPLVEEFFIFFAASLGRDREVLGITAVIYSVNSKFPNKVIAGVLTSIEKIVQLRIFL